ncbi:hypothetical protein J8281_13890 [Aquimarina sp. U1-2]|uniref:RHS repeat domain-containing protein n=1 Tax=Aquimarina sp. U1-2 TaxID=2823141 RepID=UPI001AEC821A|nr:RHS repeat-associated core domain-containing protein [Aquimarina sp. U1-2]MBP2833281.1 hypothetical protein [Aquimarina sp. U1-2]
MKKFLIFCFVLNAISQAYAQSEDDALDCSFNDQIWVDNRYYDLDNDGIGGARISMYVCKNKPLPGVIRGGDCNDNNRNIRGPKTWYRDKDGDTYGSYTVTETSCIQPVGYVGRSGDCNDNDENLIFEERYYIDSDGDGKGAYGSTAVMSCGEPSGNYVNNAQDCDDNNRNNWQNSVWYVDTDDDGLGEGAPVVSSVSYCQPPNDGKKYVSNNNDRCPGLYGEEDGCPPPPPPNHTLEESKNTVKIIGYDITGKIIAQSKSYFDNLGKLVQVQTKDFKTGETWASSTLYDSQGRQALRTLSAPTNRDIPLDFFYRSNFIRKNDGNTFSVADFENNPEDPTIVGNQENTLGWYYSAANTQEPYQDVTQRPYSRTIYSDLNPGAVLKTIGGNKINNQWKNGYSFSMPAGQELSKNVAFGEAKYNGYKVIKTVTRDVHGVENVIFTDTDGKTLASARSGDAVVRYATVEIGLQEFVDIHIPKGTKGIEKLGTASNQLRIYNLITEKVVNASISSLNPGFYRIVVLSNTPRDRYNPEIQPIYIKYPENYYDYSLNYYDKAGRLLRSKQPLNHLESTFQYNSLGQLETTTSPDEGNAWFHYRKDGQIRLSINSQQLIDKKISFTDYDNRARPVASGIIVYPDLTPELLNAFLYDRDGIDANDPLAIALFDESLQIAQLLQQNPDVSLQEVYQTTYDLPDLSGLKAAFGTDNRSNNYTTQSFVAGNVSKTSNSNTTTWYSYDIYGRVQWIVQNIAGLGVKTIDYEYNAISGLIDKVIYQKDKPDQFIHRYTYDQADYSLIKVETSTDDTKYIEHAQYEYYQTGALKRINLAKNLQGIDYVYNLQGALKSINHPSLKGQNDPSGDTDDLFGMIIDYHEHDYNRPLRNIKSASYGTNQYNGNIKGIRWNSSYNPVAGKEHTYQYQYNRNNWLQKAEYGQFTGDYTSLPVITEEQLGNAPQDYITTTDITNSGSTKNYFANQAITLKPGFHAKSGSTVSAKISQTGPIHDVNAGSFLANSNGDYKVSNLTYDANGNIQSLFRNKHTESGSNAMDQLSYVYKTDKPNQLLRVDDAAGDVPGAKDIGDQNGDNYEYNQIGQLIKNHEENIHYLYNASGLVTEVQKDNQPLVKFFYNDKGYRVKKERYNPTNGSLIYTEHYVRDAAGSALAIYRNGQLIENTIYGASRLGVRISDGTNLYQLTDHLGNVRAVVGRTAYGEAIGLNSATDYYPFGMPMPNRKTIGEPYRYGYQGQEVDPETRKEAFELRLWDSRIGRWLTTDPYGEFSSPYLGMGNNPVVNIDPDGGCVSCINQGTLVSIASTAQTQLNTVNLGVLERPFSFSDLWNNDITRGITGDAISFGGGYAANIFLGADVNAEFTWILRGKDASFKPNVTIGPAITVGDGGEVTASAFLSKKFYNGSVDQINVRDLGGYSTFVEGGLALGLGAFAGADASLNDKLQPTWVSIYGGVSGGAEASPLTGANIKAGVRHNTMLFHNNGNLYINNPVEPSKNLIIDTNFNATYE